MDITLILASLLAVVQPCTWQGSEDGSYIATGSTAVCVEDCASDCWTLDQGLQRLVALVPAEDSAGTVPVVFAVTDDNSCLAGVYLHRGGQGQVNFTDPPVEPPGRLSPGWLEVEDNGICVVETRWPLGWATPTDGGAEEWADDVCGRISSAYDFVRAERFAGCERLGAVGTSGGAVAMLCLMAAGGEVADSLSWLRFSSMAPSANFDAVIAQVDAERYRWTETSHSSNVGTANCGTSSASDDSNGVTPKVNEVFALPWPIKERLTFTRTAHSSAELCQGFPEFDTLKQLSVDLVLVATPTPSPTPSPTPTPTPAPTGACCNQAGTNCHDDYTEMACDDLGGIWQGAGSLCSEGCS